MSTSNKPDLTNTSIYSYYVDADFYANALENSKEWTEAGVAVSAETRAEIEQLIFFEHRLLDEARMEQWLEMLTEDCLYWIPATPGGGDPRKEVTIAFDDRRRVEDRVYRLRTGYAWSQVPASRTVRVSGNLEVYRGQDDSTAIARCNFIMTEFRAGRTKLLSGWYGYRLRKVNGAWKIAVKKVNLLDSDQAHENLTVLL